MSRSQHLFIFGLGYTALRFGAYMRGKGWRVSGTVRSREKADSLLMTGIGAYVFDGAAPVENAKTALKDVTHILSSAPPDDQTPADPVLRHHLPILKKIQNLEWVGYLSSTGVYGDTQGAWVDETAPIGAGRRQARAEADREWQAAAVAGLPVHIFRLPGIYGPGRSAISRAKSGNLNRIDAPHHVFSRIHVDDIAQALEASIKRPNPSAIYNVADDEPAPGHEVAAYACELLGLEPPPLQALDDVEMSAAARRFYAECRRVSNERLKKDLKVKLKYPSYREGLRACLAAGD